MHFPTLTTLTLLTLPLTLLASPIPQLAGEGAACNSILSSTDNGVGYGIEDGENNIAGNIGTAKGAVPGVPATPGVPARRQLAGEGAACDSVFSSTDNGVGYGIEDAEDNIAGNIGTVKGAAGGATGGGGGGGGGGGKPPPPPPPHRRQLDKIANGAAAISGAAGTGDVTKPATDAADAADGALTGGAAGAGAMVGDAEVATLEGAGMAVPRKRQLDKIANGAAAISGAAGTGDVTKPATDAADAADGALTGGAAGAGAMVGDAEVATLEGVGMAVPR